MANSMPADAQKVVKESKPIASDFSRAVEGVWAALLSGSVSGQIEVAATSAARGR